MSQQGQTNEKLPFMTIKRTSFAPRFSLTKPPSLTSLLSLASKPRTSIQNPNTAPFVARQSNASAFAFQTGVFKLLEEGTPLKKGQRKKLLKLLYFLYIYDRPAYEQFSANLLEELRRKMLIGGGIEQSALLLNSIPPIQPSSQTLPSDESLEARDSALVKIIDQRASKVSGQPLGQDKRESVLHDFYGRNVAVQGQRHSSFLPYLYQKRASQFERPSDSSFKRASHFKGETADEDPGLGDSAPLFVEPDNPAPEPRLAHRSTENLDHIPALPLVKSIGGCAVTEQDVSLFRRSGIVNEALLDYFLAYLAEKQRQMDQSRLERLGIKSLIFPAKLLTPFRSRANRYDHYSFDYECVRQQVANLSGQGEAAFDAFDLIFLPFNENGGEFKLIVVQLKANCMRLFDPLKLANARDDKHSALNGLFKLAVKFVEAEHFARTKRARGAHWQFFEHEAPRVQERSANGLQVCFFAYSVAKGEPFPLPEGPLLEAFREKMLGLFDPARANN